MRRKDRQIESVDAVREVIGRCQVLHLAMVDGDHPYVCPLSYGYLEPDMLYLHSASEGRKLDILRAAPQVCFAISTDHELIRGERPCGWGFRYRGLTPGVGFDLQQTAGSVAEAEGPDSVLGRDVCAQPCRQTPRRLLCRCGVQCAQRHIVRCH